MEKFTSISRPKTEVEEKDPTLFKNDNIKVIEYENSIICEEKDQVICIPFLIEYNQFIIRQEPIAAFKKREGQEQFVTVISGTINDNENIEFALKRELQDEAGIVLRDTYKLEFEKPLFASKTGTMQYHYCLIPLAEADYHEVLPKENSDRRSKCVKVDVKYINGLNISDTITELLMLKLKKYLNIQ